jgi:hypothetical protein
MGSWIRIAPEQAVRPTGRRPLCLLLADRPMPAALREVSSTGAWVETPARPAHGAHVWLRHADAGTISGHVIGHDKEGLHIVIDPGEKATAFALAVIASDMSNPID